MIRATAVALRAARIPSGSAAAFGRGSSLRSSVALRDTCRARLTGVIGAGRAVSRRATQNGLESVGIWPARSRPRAARAAGED